ncbi:MAG: FMN-binding protein [Sphaerochaetaceae bacterium]|jgi:uncharacterized protein with FMN-binding domain|nr:FMN-binding protein [Sphaerochaetaceae bacterium]
MKKHARQKGGRNMWWVVLLIIVAVIAAGLAVGVLLDAPGRKEALDLTFSAIDFKNLKDGTYTGEYQGTKSHMRDTKVEISVSAGNVSDIKILKGAVDTNGKAVKMGKDQTISEVFQNVLQSQSLDVDVISGATITTKTHLKALEQALVQAQR